MLRLLALLFLGLVCFSSTPSFADEACGGGGESQSAFMEIVNQFSSQAAATDCRPEGYRCRHSGECCGVCRDNVCSGGSGPSGNRPEGAACRHSGECAGVCRDGYCTGGSGGPSCRGAGLKCDHSGQCCAVCRDHFCT